MKRIRIVVVCICTACLFRAESAIADRKRVVTPSGHSTGYYVEDSSPSIPRSDPRTNFTSRASAAYIDPSIGRRTGEAMEEFGQAMQSSIAGVLAANQQARSNNTRRMVPDDVLGSSDFQKHGKIKIKDDDKNGFTVVATYSIYQFYPDEDVVRWICQKAAKQKAIEHVRKQNRSSKAEGFSMDLESKTNRNVLFGITSCKSICNVSHRNEPDIDNNENSIDGGGSFGIEGQRQPNAAETLDLLERLAKLREEAI